VKYLHLPKNPASAGVMSILVLRTEGARQCTYCLALTLAYFQFLHRPTRWRGAGARENRGQEMGDERAASRGSMTPGSGIEMQNANFCHSLGVHKYFQKTRTR